MVVCVECAADSTSTDFTILDVTITLHNFIRYAMRFNASDVLRLNFRIVVKCFHLNASIPGSVLSPDSKGKHGDCRVKRLSG
jgi:hypothetical protein